MYYTLEMKMFTLLNKINIISLFLTLLVGFSMPSGLAAEDLEAKKIEYLLLAIENSGANFERNGSIHKASEAKGHLAFKLQKATSMFLFFGPKKEIKATDFIEKIASKSSSSGEPYYIITAEGKKELGPWLSEKLKNFPN